MKNDYVLLVTGCISPDSKVPFLELKDNEERRKQYVKSLRYYIKHTNAKKIVYCDNSNQKYIPKLKKEASECNKQFEWVSFLGDTKKCLEKGKGYGEGEIIEYALKNSKLLKEASYFIKVTGRVIIKNYNILVRFMNKNNTYFLRNSADNIDTKFYGMSINNYKNFFMHSYNYVDDKNDKYLEHVFSDVIKDKSIAISDFIVFPNSVGVSGSTGEKYDLSFKRRLKENIKIIARRFRSDG